VEGSSGRASFTIQRAGKSFIKKKAQKAHRCGEDGQRLYRMKSGRRFERTKGTKKLKKKNGVWAKFPIRRETGREKITKNLQTGSTEKPFHVQGRKGMGLRKRSSEPSKRQKGRKKRCRDKGREWQKNLRRTRTWARGARGGQENQRPN